MKRLIFILLLVGGVFAQTPPTRGSAVVTVSGTAVTFNNPTGAINVTFEEIFTGAPATVSVVMQGCMRGGTCDTIETYTTVANSNRPATAPTKAYDTYVITPSWTGGTNATTIINQLSTISSNPSGGTGGGTGSSLTGPFLPADGTITNPAYSFLNSSGSGFYRAGAADVRYTSGGVDQARFAPAFIVGASSGVNFASTGVQSVNAALVYDGTTGVLGQRSGVTAQGHRIYNTFTDASNNEYGTFDWTTTASTLTIGSVANGTGTGRSVVLQAAGASSISFKVNGAIKFFVNSSGNFVAGSDNANDIGAAGASRPRTLFVGTSVNSPTYLTTTNCSSAAGTCVAAPAGSVTIAAAATTVTVATTAVTASSQILLTEDSSLGTKLTVTCNTTLGRHYAVTARTAATSFVITTDAAPTTNPACLSYSIIN